MLALPQGAELTGPIAAGRILGGRRVAGQQRREVGLDPNGTHARSAATVGDGERLVKVDMAHVGPEVSRPAQSNLGIEICAVEVHLSPMGVSNRRDALDGLLEDPVSRRVCDHHRGKFVRVRLGLGFQVCDVDRPVFVARDHHDSQAGQSRRRGIGAVSAGGNQAHRAMALATALMEAPNHEQPRKLSLSSRVRLKAHGVVAGDFAKHIP